MLQKICCFLSTTLTDAAAISNAVSVEILIHANDARQEVTFHVMTRLVESRYRAMMRLIKGSEMVLNRSNNDVPQAMTCINMNIGLLVKSSLRL
jgi:hypothetical protein